MTYAEIDALLVRIATMPDDISADALCDLLGDSVAAMRALAAALRPFAQVANHGTPSDCNGMLQQADWERVAQMFAPPKAQG